ncbi:MAG: glycoside hydrolase family 16 protein [Hyphomicrobiales bacterium]|nr:MAG: glycoside hydrolase family 16 protein [Hyphomicrobiales bacterium]
MSLPVPLSRVARRLRPFFLATYIIGNLTPARALEPLIHETFAMTSRALPDGAWRAYPDPAIWGFTFWPGGVWPTSYGDGTHWLEGNHESQIYTSAFLTSIDHRRISSDKRYDPFSVTDAGLHIRAAPLTREQQALYKVGGHRRFGSGMLRSKAAFTYGRIRMQARVPQAQGAWSALWLLPQDHQWPPEIDVFEAMPWANHKGQIHIGVIGAPTDGQLPALEWRDVKASPAEGLHEYGLDWSADRMDFLFDGEVIRSQPTPPSLRNRPMYLLVTLAVGGKWPYNELGIQPIDGTSPERLETGATRIEPDYPAEMLIRSIRVEPLR